MQLWRRPRVGRRRRRAAGRRAGGAAHRPRRRAAPGQGAVPRRGRPAHAAAGGGLRRRPAWASPGWAGSSRSTSTAWSTPSAGTAAAACPTARASRSGRWPRWCASGSASPRRTRPTPPRAKLVAGLERVAARPDERAYVGPRLAQLLGVPVIADPGGTMARDELFAGWRTLLRADGRRSRSCSWSRTCSTPTPACWTSSTTCSTGPATCRSSCWCSPGPSWTTPGRAGAPAATAPCCPRPARRRVDGRAGRRPRARHAGRGPATDHRPGPGHPAVRGRDLRSLVDRDVVRPIDGVYRLVGDVGSCTSRTACTPCWPPGSTRSLPTSAAGRRRCRARNAVPGGGARGGLRPASRRRARGAWPSCCAARC